MQKLSQMQCADAEAHAHRGLRNYHLRVLQSLEAGVPMYHAVQNLWDDAGNFSEPESEEEEMEVV